MKKVIVIISTYNGSKHIKRQLDSIFAQTSVDVKVVVRDDSSKDDTVQVIKDYRKKTGYDISVISGENEGYAKSFWDGLCQAEDADYYAFSDQDDVWKEDKLIKSIQPMEISTSIGPMLSYCKMQRSDEQLNRLDEQVKVLRLEDLSKKLCLTQTYNYGAATVFNREARKLICSCWPNRDDVPHDLWAGMLCYWFGKVFFIDEELYYWIRYETSVTGEGTKKSGRSYRFEESLKGKSYPNVAATLLDNFGDLLLNEDKVFLHRLTAYKHHLPDKVKLLFDSGLKRNTYKGTLMLKAGILLNWF